MLNMIARLHARLPKRVVDAHAHLFRSEDANFPDNHPLAKGPAECSMDNWKAEVGRLVGDADLTGGLFMAFPTLAGDVEAGNQYTLDQLKPVPDARGLVMVRPEDAPERVKELLAHPRMIGIKPYHVYSASAASFDSPLESFVPEWMWRLADEQGLLMMIHLVRGRALADEVNWRTLRDMADQYPRGRIILAHAARGFNPWHTIEGVERLAELDNVFFDSSAICEPDALAAVLHEFGPRKLLWGSDYPVCRFVGKCVSVADGFVWLSANSLDWQSLSPKCQPTTVGVESLRALIAAADQVGLDESDLEDIFANNALRLLGLQEKEANSTGELYHHAKERIPGGVQLLSKRPELFAPDQWPAYFREARGCETWDLDGRRYVDMSTNGIGSCLLGFRDQDVARAPYAIHPVDAWRGISCRQCDLPDPCAQ